MLWTWWLGASSGILLAMSSQACMEKNEGSPRSRLQYVFDFVRYSLGTTCR
jgi:hypothetical protein